MLQGLGMEVRGARAAPTLGLVLGGRCPCEALVRADRVAGGSARAMLTTPTLEVAAVLATIYSQAVVEGGGW